MGTTKSSQGRWLVLLCAPGARPKAAGSGGCPRIQLPWPFVRARLSSPVELLRLIRGVPSGQGRRDLAGDVGAVGQVFFPVDDATVVDQRDQFSLGVWDRHIDVGHALAQHLVHNCEQMLDALAGACAQGDGIRVVDQRSL